MRKSGTGEQTESSTVKTICTKVNRLAAHLAEPPRSKEVRDMFRYVARLRDIQGNLSNDLSALACVLAKQYLRKHHDLPDYNATAKPQGARGLDVNVTTSRGGRVVGEIKTTVPLYKDEFGAMQEKTILADLRRLRRTKAEVKYFFVTNTATKRVLLDASYADDLRGVTLVLLR